MFGVTFLFDCVIHYNTSEAFLTLCWIYNYYGTWLTILQTFSSYFPKSYKVEVVLATILFVFRLKFILFFWQILQQSVRLARRVKVGEERNVLLMTDVLLTQLVVSPFLTLQCGWQLSHHGIKHLHFFNNNQMMSVISLIEQPPVLCHYQ